MACSSFRFSWRLCAKILLAGGMEMNASGIARNFRVGYICGTGDDRNMGGKPWANAQRPIRNALAFGPACDRYLRNDCNTSSCSYHLDSLLHEVMVLKGFCRPDASSSICGKLSRWFSKRNTAKESPSVVSISYPKAMSAISPKNTHHLIIRFHDTEQKVLIETDDGDRFLTTAAEIASVLGIVKAENIMKFHGEWMELNQRLGEWIKEHQASIKSAYLAPRDRCLLFIVVPIDPRYRDDFEDQLSDLDIEIANNPAFSTIHLSVMSLPTDAPAGLDCFIGGASSQDA